MKKFFIIFLLCGSIIYLYADNFQPLDILQKTHIDSALSKIKMTREDLTFNLNLTKADTFRLSLINRLFRKPLSTFNVCDSIAEYHFQNIENLDSLIIFDSKLLDVDFKKSETAKPKEFQLEISFEELHPTNKKILTSILTALPEIMSNIDSAYSSFSDSELVFLKKYAKEYFLQSEDIKEKSLKELNEAEIEDREKSKKFGKIASKLERGNLVNAAVLTSQLIYTIDSLVFASKDSLFFNDKIALETEYGKIAINPSNNTNISNYIFVIDYTGNDIYKFSKENKFSVILDYSGDDIYIGEDFCQGAGYFGINFLIDYKGDDLYSAKNYAQGIGYFGIGILSDKKGDDKYFAQNMVQGGSAYGIGLLLDNNGNDTYECCLYGQGFGFCWGFGGLIDNSGNDNYLVTQKYVDILRYDEHFESLSQGFGFGMRPYYSGGIGILADKNGNDNYLSDIYGQGVAYWYALGGLVDREGNDHYKSYQYAQGAGVHLAFGTLIDYFGNDNYNSKGVSQGCGHDYAFGGLYDFQGDDNYVCYDLSQGAGNADAISFFLDANGDDGYIAKRDITMGYSDLRRGFGYIGLFLDLNGNDFYGSLWGENNNYWIHSTYGIGVDSKNSYLDTLAPGKEYDMKPADEPLGEDIETLFMQASAASQKFQYLVQPAREKIIAMGDSAMPFLVDKLNTESARESHALYEMIPKIGKPAVPFLEKVLQDSVKDKIRFTMIILGKIKEESSYPILAEYTQSKNPSYRASSIKALGDLGYSKAIPLFIESLKDSIVSVRRESAIALQKINNQNAVLPLIAATDDEFQEVRYSAEIALIKIGVDAEKIIQKNYSKVTVRSKKHLIGYFAKCKGKTNKKFLKKLLKNETNEELLFQIKRVFNNY
ncbi:MAG: HEAT repeat domain-containing protein [Candidatus Cloacimonadota bacterium]|nr:HEAT repeat domain-containing protein [Candidatus Cloacimonadota bacterium]